MLYTKKGDKGTSKLYNSNPGERITKTDKIFDALGTVDELNSILGFCKIEAATTRLLLPKKIPLDRMLHGVQENLFIIQAELAGSDMSISENIISEMEMIIDTIEQELPPIKTFFISGGTELAARCDLARTVSRRTERAALRAIEGNPQLLSTETKAYLNRLSSLLYACARFVNYRAGIKESAPLYK